MSEGPDWFAAKKVGYGTGLPIAWQGWAVLLTYLALVGAASRWLGNSPIALAGVVIPATAALILIAARTTRGGWHWR